MLRLVIDTNLWLRALLGGKATLFVLDSWQQHRFIPIVSDDLLAELGDVCQRPRFQPRIRQPDLMMLLHDLRHQSHFVVPSSIPPFCRDPKDYPVLAAAIDGRAHAIVSGDSDLRGDEALRAAMAELGVGLWGIDTLRRRLF